MRRFRAKTIRQNQTFCRASVPIASPDKPQTGLQISFVMVLLLSPSQVSASCLLAIYRSGPSPFGFGFSLVVPPVTPCYALVTALLRLALKKSPVKWGLLRCYGSQPPNILSLPPSLPPSSSSPPCSSSSSSSFSSSNPAARAYPRHSAAIRGNPRHKKNSFLPTPVPTNSRRKFPLRGFDTGPS